MLIVTIRAATVEIREVDTVNGLKTFRSQKGFVELNDEVRKIRIPLAADQDPYAPGRYTLSPSSYGVGRFGDIEINRYELGLVPFDAAPKMRGAS